MIHILIIEDDPMVQYIHQSYLEKINLGESVHTSSTIETSLDILEKKPINLILLDIHLEDGNGLELLSKLRKDKRDIDVILITASKEVILVKESLHLGVVDYLIKPFTFERFKQSLDLYCKKRDQLKQPEMNQTLIDTFLQPKQPNNDLPMDEMEKGLTTETLTLVTRTIQSLDRPFTIQELSVETKLSHVSVRKYVAHLEKNNQLTSQNIYLKVGRPYKVYAWHP